jgi:hypothetical protein
MEPAGFNLNSRGFPGTYGNVQPAPVPPSPPSPPAGGREGEEGVAGLPGKKSYGGDRSEMFDLSDDDDEAIPNDDS